MLYGFGNPLMDIIVRVPHEAIARLGVAAGSMNLVDYERQQEALNAGVVVRQLPGGSCANTVRGVRWLRWLREQRYSHAAGTLLTAAYTGAVGRDRDGQGFEALLETEGVIPLLARKRTPTGSSVILVTPDSQRTMFTYLGACRELEEADLDRVRIREASILHTTGYMWDTENQERAARSAVTTARAARTLVSFDVADPFVVKRYRESLLQWIPGNVDVLFANQEELQELTGRHGDEQATLRAAADLAPTVAMKTGARGCAVMHRGTVYRCAAHPAERVDTTGAGDAFAAGYLFGLLYGLEAAACAAAANIVAGGIVSVDGCNYDALPVERMRPAIERVLVADTR